MLTTVVRPVQVMFSSIPLATRHGAPPPVPMPTRPLSLLVSDDGATNRQACIVFEHLS